MKPSKTVPSVHFLCALLFSIVLCAPQTASALILYSGDNSANTTAPSSDRAVIFNAIARIGDSNGTGVVGSAVHLKGKYCLTAEHVLYKNQTPRRTHISFNGEQYHAIDLNFLPIQISTADLVLFKLVEDPNLSEKELYTGSNESGQTGTLIGWGKGRDENQADQTGANRSWSWGSNDTIDKRWGTNQVESMYGPNPNSGINYHHLTTQLNTNAGDNEAAFAYYDSGSGLFSYNGNTESWQLIGITTAVTTLNSSTFGNFFSAKDTNFFVRVSQYAALIENALPDTSTFSGWAIDNSLYGADADPSADSDGDGLNQTTEFNLNTDPNDADSDDDGLSDGDEVNAHSTDPNDADSDADGLSDGDEINTHQSNPNQEDSDGDGLSDGDEVTQFGTNPSNSDTDGDSLSDPDELNLHNTDPNNADSDGDGLNDAAEINTHLTDPNDADSSGDEFSDGALVDFGLDPNSNHSLLKASIESAMVDNLQDLRPGSILIEVNDGQVDISLELESSSDLETWDETDASATLQVPASSQTQFYRFKLSD